MFKKWIQTNTNKDRQKQIGLHNKKKGSRHIYIKKGRQVKEYLKMQKIKKIK